MNPRAEALRHRTHEFFVRVVRFSRTLTRDASAASISSQLLDAAGSVDSNYGAACKARTRRQFIDRVGIASEEADEAKRWLEALRDAGLADGHEAVALITEANELTFSWPRTRPHNTVWNKQSAKRKRNGPRAESGGRGSDRHTANRQPPVGIPHSTHHIRQSAIDNRQSVNRRSAIDDPQSTGTQNERDPPGPRPSFAIRK